MDKEKLKLLQELLREFETEYHHHFFLSDIYGPEDEMTPIIPHVIKLIERFKEEI